jgi:DNA-binding Xre family transcriptional regulator
MQWNLRLTAAQRGIWRACDLRRLLAAAGLEISAGKMSHLWSGRPISIRLDDLDIICAVLSCDPGDLLIRDPAAGQPPSPPPAATAATSPPPVATAATSPPVIRPARRGRRPVPPL